VVIPGSPRNKVILKYIPGSPRNKVILNYIPGSHRKKRYRITYQAHPETE